VEEGTETTNPGGVEPARELPDGILLQQELRLPARRDPSDQSRPEHRPPELVVGGLIDQDVILKRKQPGQRPGREPIAPIAEQVGGGAADDKIDLELGMAMGSGSNLADPVPRHASIEASLNSEVIDHRKKRSEVASLREDTTGITADYVIVHDRWEANYDDLSSAHHVRAGAPVP
jgi:hypothetical protein